jgi:excinuclease ABC subunit C
MNGIDAIKHALKTMPTKPGVYRMLDAEGSVLYVGKAKNLKNRVSNYASPAGLSTRIMRMVEQTATMEIVIAQNEAEALLLESALIKKFQPRYNILLKDDKSFPYIAFTHHDFPRLKKHRGAQKAGAQYFGPFPSAGAVNQTLTVLQKAFLLRPCSDSIFKNRTRPCLQYQIKRCSAPCVGYVTPEQYAEQLAQAAAFLRGKNSDVQARLGNEMEAASAAMEYEKAAALRDRIKALTQIQHQQLLHAHGIKDADVITMMRDEEISIIQVAIFRSGQHFGHYSLFPKHQKDASNGEIMAAFMGQFYQRHTPPPDILVNHLPDDVAIMNDALTVRAERAVTVKKPQRGEKAQLMAQAEKTAEAALKRKRDSQASNQQHRVALAALFGLESAPERIEVVDNSHVMGSHAIGAMIVAGPDGFEKNQYRKFNMSDVTAGDDVGMMREMLTRRFTRALKEDTILPDLFLIDGGKGQLNACASVMETLGLQHVPLVAIAKGVDRHAGREWFFQKGRAPFQLPENDPTLHYLQRLRDEAHRFAITSHRNKRSKAISDSALDDIPGVGGHRKRALLRYFGSRRAVENATINELASAPGISHTLAETIYEYFHAN